MFLYRPDAGIVLAQQIALGRFRLLPHIGDTEHQILKGDGTVLASGQSAFRAVRPGEGKRRASKRRIVRVIQLENGQLAGPNVVVDGQFMPGIVLRHSLTVLGDCHLIDRFIPVIACPAGALLDAVNTIG